MKITLLLQMLLAAALPMYMSDPQIGAAGEAADPLAADKAALAAAQEKLATDQADHDQKQAALDTASDAHAQAHIALQADQEALAAAQEKLATDQADHDQKQAALAAAQEKLATGQAALTEAQAAVPAAATVAAIPVEAHDTLAEIDAVGIKWGGEIGTDLRNLVGKLKGMFEKKAAAETPAGGTTS